MHPRTPKLLEDIRDAAAFIVEATRGKTQADHGTDRLLRHAVERNFEIIGEAVKRIARHDEASAAALAAYAQIIAFRDVLIHGCDLVDHALVWNAVEGPPPTLLVRVRELQGAGGD